MDQLFNMRRSERDRRPGREWVRPDDYSTGRPQTPEQIAAHNAVIHAEAEKPFIFPWEKGTDVFGKTPTGRGANKQPFNMPRPSQEELDRDQRIFDEAEARIRSRRYG